jgi:hypothetical protein
MKYSSWIGFVAAVTVIVVCYSTWVFIPSAQLSIGGMLSSAKNNFGRPGLLHLILTGVAAILFVLPRTWAKRTNIFFTGLNMAWAVRNYIVLTKCYAGDCPEKKGALYLLIIACAVMLLMSMLPDMELKNGKRQN